MNYLKHKNYLNQIPPTGQHILAQQRDDQILVYQAFNPRIADFAVNNQYFGGSHYSYERMSWIKPNFLWMMYRCGWASKSNKERVLGIWIDKKDFDSILAKAAYSSFKPDIYESHESWRQALVTNPVRLQWDPDHDIYGQKQERKAIQLGMKGEVLQTFGKAMIREIIDVTDFVLEQQKAISEKRLEDLLIPDEQIYLPEDEGLIEFLGLVVD